MLTGTLTTLIDTHWFSAEGEERLEQLIAAFFRRSNTTILIEGPDCAKRLREFLYAYLQLSHQITDMVTQKARYQSNSTTFVKLKNALQECYVWNMKCDQLSALSMSYVQLRIVEDLSSYLNWLSDYDITLSNALVHTLLEPTGVHQLDKKAYTQVKNIRMSLKPTSLKSTNHLSNSSTHLTQQTQSHPEANASQALPCFSHQWGIRWCVAIGM